MDVGMNFHFLFLKKTYMANHIVQMGAWKLF